MTTKPFVFISRGIPPMSRGLQKLKEQCNIKMYDGSKGMVIPKEYFYACVKGAEGAFVIPPDRIDAEFLDAAGPQLKVVGTMSVGLEHIDLPECKRRGVKVGYTPDVLTDAVAEETVALTLATARRFKEGLQDVVNGGWGSTWADSLYLAGKDIKNSTLGIVGLGRIGLAVAKRLVPFGVKDILYCGRSKKSYDSEINAKFVPFDDLLRESDFVIACCSINPSNVKLFNAEAFKKMKNSAIFINTTRGSLVDQDDLYEALKGGELYAAGLDVTTPEPIPRDSPLLTLNNCTIVPHLGSASVVARNAMTDLTVENILAGLKGEPLVTPAPM